MSDVTRTGASTSDANAAPETLGTMLGTTRVFTLGPTVTLESGRTPLLVCVRRLQLRRPSLRRYRERGLAADGPGPSRRSPAMGKDLSRCRLRRALKRTRA